MTRWFITVVERETLSVLFAGNTTDAAELEAVAAEARRLRPRSQIFIRPPMGQPPYEWP